jgi:hypothetical protein
MPLLGNPRAVQRYSTYRRGRKASCDVSGRTNLSYVSEQRGETIVTSCRSTQFKGDKWN